MEFYNEKTIFKKIIKDSKKYQKYYSSLLSSNNSQSESKIKDDNRDNSNKNYEDNNYNSNDNKCNTNSIFKKISLKSIGNKKQIFNLMALHRMKLKPISKRHLIYNEILRDSNSIFSPKYNKKIKLKPLKSIRSINNSLLTSSNRSINDKSHIINFSIDYEKEFFPNIDYTNLEYNEYEIYKSKLF